jgi:tripartite-type tricarboxylate transporter receptor subunit TctC
MHTISSAVLNKFLYTRVKLDVNASFAPISQIGTASQLLAINANVPAKTLQEFIALLKANPGKYHYGSSGLGAIMHLGGELFSFMTDTKVVHVPYRGEGPAMVDILAGRIQFVVASVPAVLQHIRSGEMRALCVNADHRLALLPDVPTSAEAGLPGYKTYNWYALFAPMGTPEPIIQRLNEAVVKGLATPEARKQLEDIGIEPLVSNPSDLAVELKQQADFWGPLIATAPRDFQFARSGRSNALKVRIRHRSLRRIDVAPDGDIGRRKRPIGLLLRRSDKDLGSNLKVGGAARRVAGDRRVGWHYDILFTVFVFDQQILAIFASDRCRDIGVRHSAPRHAIPRSEAIGHDAALRIHENVNSDGLLTAVGLRHGGYADE